MPRANLSRLLDAATPDAPPAPAVADAADAPVVERRDSPADKVPASNAEPSGPVSEAHSEPLYLRLERKDVRLREDQLIALATQVRRLTKARRNRGYRITENTLIRVAVDLLLARADELAGDDEDALRGSVLS